MRIKLPNLVILVAIFVSTTLSATDTSSKLSVRGEATIYAPPDQLSLSIGVTTESDKAEIALEENKVRMRRIIQQIENLGLNQSSYSTGSFSIIPRYSNRPKDASPDWQPTIVGYEVRNSMTIRTDKLDLAGDIIDNLTKSGANTIDNVRFNLKNDALFREKAIQAATKNAMHEARILANSANLTLNRIVQISLDESSISPPVFKTARFALNEQTPIKAGKVPVRAMVLVIYEVEQNSQPINQSTFNR